MIFNRLLKTSDSSSFFLFGARGTGKTTYIKQAFDQNKSLYIDLLDPENEDTYQRTPQRFEQEVLALSPEVEWVIVDEVQRSPRLLDVVHRLIESSSKKFVLTGSSSRKLRRGVANLLGGRAFVYNLFPLTVPELGDAFLLDEALSWGTLPRIYSLEQPDDKQAFLRSYALTYLREEIVVEQLVRKLDPFRLFLEVAAQSNGLIVNFANVAKDVGVDPKTVVSYFNILEDTNVGLLIPAYRRSVRKQQNANPKFYFFDTGIKRALDRTLSVPVVEGTYEYGRLFEQFIVNQLSHLVRYLYPDWQLSYLRSGSGAEIDLIIERPGLADVLIEIKSSARVGERDVRVLGRFMPSFEFPLALLISRDPSRLNINGILCVHWLDALGELGLM